MIKNNAIYAVIGGFHLKEVDENTKKVIDYFFENNIKNIYLGIVLRMSV